MLKTLVKKTLRYKDTKQKLNIIKKTCNLQNTKYLKLRDRKNMIDMYASHIYVCVYMDIHICVCAILTFYFTNFITNHSFLRSTSSKKKVLRSYLT